VYATLKAAVRRQVVKHPSICLPLARLLRRAGDEARAGRLARAANVIAPVVRVRVAGAVGATFRIDSCGGRDQVASASWFEGSRGFERPLPDLIAFLARHAAGAFLDVGANTGFYSLLAWRANAGLRIHAFEPFPPVLEILERNLALNGRPAGISVCASAAGAENGTARLYVPLQDHGLVESSCSLESTFKDAHSAVVDVPVTTIDHYVAREGVSGVSMIKIDVEGHEDKVFRGADATLRRFRPSVVFELLPRADADAIDSVRGALDYVSFRLRGGELVDEAHVAIDDTAWNHVMFPRERVDLAEAFRAALRG
jgi:FkbM family methyltransferase